MKPEHFLLTGHLLIYCIKEDNRDHPQKSLSHAEFNGIAKTIKSASQAILLLNDDVLCAPIQQDT